MTLKTCKKRLELAKTPEEVKFWEERITRRMLKLGIQPEPKVEVKDGNNNTNRNKSKKR